MSARLYADCTCPCYDTWRDWDAWCPVHGIDARIAAGVWPASMRDLWQQARRTA